LINGKKEKNFTEAGIAGGDLTKEWSNRGKDKVQLLANLKTQRTPLGRVNDMGRQRERKEKLPTKTIEKLGFLSERQEKSSIEQVKLPGKEWTRGVLKRKGAGSKRENSINLGPRRKTLFSVTLRKERRRVQKSRKTLEALLAKAQGSRMTREKNREKKKNKKRGKEMGPGGNRLNSGTGQYNTRSHHILLQEKGRKMVRRVDTENGMQGGDHSPQKIQSPHYQGLSEYVCEEALTPLAAKQTKSDRSINLWDGGGTLRKSRDRHLEGMEPI